MERTYDVKIERRFVIGAEYTIIAGSEKDAVDRAAEYVKVRMERVFDNAPDLKLHTDDVVAHEISETP